MADKKPTKQEVIKALKRIYGYCVAEAHRYGPQKPEQPLIKTLEFLKKEFEITDEDLE